MLRFLKKDRAKETEKKRIVKEAEQLSKDTFLSARDCLQDPKFEKYKVKYETLQKLLIAELILIDEEEYEPLKYAFKVKDIVSKLRHAGSLLRTINSEAGKSCEV